VKSNVSWLIVIGLFAVSFAWSQPYSITTIAGGAPPPTPAAAATASVLPGSVAVDFAGNLYFTSFNCIFKVDITGTMTRVAGTSAGFSGDGGPATSAQLNNPMGLAVDAAGNIFAADYDNSRVRKISALGIMTTVAGTGIPAPAGSGATSTTGTGDGGPASAAQLSGPRSVVVDASGNLYIADGNRIRQVSSSGIITSFAGGGTGGDNGGVLGANATFFDIWGLALDSSGDMFVADRGISRVFKITAGFVTLIAGAQANSELLGLSQPVAVAADSSGNCYIADSGYNRIRKVQPNGATSTVAGGGFGAFMIGASATSTLFDPTGVAVDRSGTLVYT